MELVCPAGNYQSLKAAVDNGADAVYLGFKDETNARHFSGLNFNDRNLEDALGYARVRDVRVFVAINTYNLLYDIPQIRNTDIDILRLSPQLKDTLTIIQLFRKALNNHRNDSNRNDNNRDDTHCNGYWHNKEGFVSL